MKNNYAKTALLLINIQNDYFYKGKMELKESYETAFKAKEILEIFRKKRKTIVHIKHVATHKNATHFIAGTFGAEFFEDVTPLPKEKVIIKNNPNSFIETGLFEFLESKKINNLIIVGMMSNMSADLTVQMAKDLGFNVEIFGNESLVKLNHYLPIE